MTKFIITAAGTVLEVKVIRQARLNTRVRLKNGSKRLVATATLFLTREAAAFQVDFDGIKVGQLALIEAYNAA